ncbi:MAG: class I SAM-dependent methyltransferase, partial [Actinomycetota bacterium]|nr:class I SAM-dependent methyltransferase [Actinomycetota bacterium]
MTTPDTDPHVERDRLRYQAYADDRPLAARVAIYRYAVDPVDLHSRVLSHLGERAGGDVLDLGCGPGSYLA